MRHLIRAGLALLAGALALAFSASALAAMNPNLTVGSSTQKGAQTVALDARLGASDDWLGRLQVYVPAGYKLASPAVGDSVGTAQTQAAGAQIGPDLFFKMTGTVTAVAQTDPVTAAANASSCDNTAHLAVWKVNILGGDDNWTFPVFVDQTTGTEAQFGPYKLVACFSRTVGSGNPNGNKFVTTSLRLGGFTMPSTPGDYKWRSLWTPFAGASGDALDATGSVEAQSTVHVATSVLTISAKQTGTHVVLSGRLVVDGEPMSGTAVALKHGIAKSKLVSMGSFTTNATGTWTAHATVKKPAWFQAGVTLGKQDLGPGSCQASFGVPCLSATVGGTGLVSALLHVR